MRPKGWLSVCVGPLCLYLCPAAGAIECPKCLPQPPAQSDSVQHDNELYFSALITSYNSYNFTKFLQPLSSKGSRPLAQLMLEPTKKCDIGERYLDCEFCLKHQRGDRPPVLGCVAGESNSTRVSGVEPDNLPLCEYTTEFGSTVASTCICAHDNCTAKSDTHFTHSQAPRVRCACNLPQCTDGVCLGHQCFSVSLHDHLYMGCAQQDVPSVILQSLDNSCVTPVSQYLSSKLVGMYSWGNPVDSVLCVCSHSMCNTEIGSLLSDKFSRLAVADDVTSACRLSFDTISHNPMRHARDTCYGRRCFDLNVKHFTKTQDKDTRTLGCVQSMFSYNPAPKPTLSGSVNVTYRSSDVTYHLHVYVPGSRTAFTAHKASIMTSHHVTSTQSYPNFVLAEKSQFFTTSPSVGDRNLDNGTTDFVDSTGTIADNTSLTASLDASDAEPSSISQQSTSAPKATTTWSSPTTTSTTADHQLKPTTRNSHSESGIRTSQHPKSQYRNRDGHDVIEIRESRYGDQKQNVLQLTNEILAAGGDAKVDEDVIDRQNVQNSVLLSPMSGPVNKVRVPTKAQPQVSKVHVNAGASKNRLAADRSRAIERSVMGARQGSSSTTTVKQSEMEESILLAADRNEELEALSNPYTDYDMKTVGFAGIMVLVFFCVFVCVISFVV